VQKGFTLAETLITMAIIGIIMALSIPVVIQSTNDTDLLFKKAYNTVETTVGEMINDTALYPSGDLRTRIGSVGIFCSDFLDKINTVGTISCGKNDLTTFDASGTPTGTAANATTTNSMVFYNLHFTESTSATAGFSPTNCDGASNGGGATGIDTDIFSCVKISIDVNGASKGANTHLDQANKDIFDIYVTQTGKIAVESSTANPWDEAYILSH